MFAEFPEQWAKIHDFCLTLNSGLPNGLDDEQSARWNKSLEQGDFARTGIADVVRSLVKNVLRLRSHIRLLTSMFSFGRRVHEQIESHLRTRGLSNESSLYPDDVATWSEIQKEVVRWICTPISVGEHRFHPSQMVDAFDAGWLAAGFAAIPEHDREIQLSAFLCSLIVESWTIFECLSEDLWEAAVNNHPEAFGKLKNKLKFTYEDLEKINFDVH